MLVFVVNKHGEALMPCPPRKARMLLNEGKAKIIGYQPFSIQLLYGSSGYKQSVKVGTKLGEKHIGIAVTSGDCVLMKGEVELRTDVKSLLETRKIYRRIRRQRKTRYRKARFLNRKKPKGWLPPSLESRTANTFRWINRFSSLLPNPTLHIEIGKFEVQKLINLSVGGVSQQLSNSEGYYNTRYFVFARDNYTCQVCKKKNKIVNTHQIISRTQGGSDRADNLITVCTDCHTSDNHRPGEIFWQWMQDGKKLRSYKEPPFTNSSRSRVYEQYPNVIISYGSETTSHRKLIGLEKSLVNDAIAITGISAIMRITGTTFMAKQFRKKKRSLHEATARKGRKQPNTNSRRNSKNTKASKGFFLNDEVQTRCGNIGYISGFTGKNACYVKSINGDYIVISGKTHKQQPLKGLVRRSHQGNWRYRLLHDA
ncbi:HNH endonuclease [Sporosarcina sp. E16_3]|uniref:RNA-guided endonuclease IscB n=1 Tax=Sporosarcina sp. E16_3 TaxID=2789293 RepID=UPI001A92191D|nr:RNA-guided endonuclease IscB [Sporosarcina sp. E16_3]MBO0602562.1 HNH endonuclease [Sporosarcina sp. E16_3]